jgi:hypothetical protein
MAGSLVLIDEETVSSSTTAVTLTGIDSTYNVYVLRVSGMTVSADEAPMMRITKGGSAQTDSEYDEAKKYFKSDDAYTNGSQQNVDRIDCTATIDSGISAGGGNGIYYLFNFPNASEYSFVTVESNHLQATVDSVRGFQGGFVHTVASASDGIQISANNWASGSTLEAGEFKLYGLKK